MRTFYYPGAREVKSRKPGVSCELSCCICLVPLQEFAEGRAAVAVVSLFFSAQLGEGLLNSGKTEQWVIAEAVRPARPVQDDTFGLSTEHRQRLTVLSGGDYADEPSSTLLRWNVSQLTDQPCIVGFVFGVVLEQVGGIGGTARGMHAGSSSKGVYFQS